MDLSDREMKILLATATKAGETIKQVTRSSDREFDLRFVGTKRGGYDFAAWLPLAFIREMTPWDTPEVAHMTDYPVMALQGDWSGVRDTEEKKIWEIFDKYSKDLLEGATK